MWNPTVALGHRHPRVHRLPAADGAVLRGLSLGPARPHLGGPAAVAGRHPLRRRRRHPLPLPGPRTCGARAGWWPPWPSCSRPYFLQYAGRISVILLPWAGLPWMIAFTVLALRRGGWRYPALFALVVAMVSGINASSIIYVGVAPGAVARLRRGRRARGHLAPGRPGRRSRCGGLLTLVVLPVVDRRAAGRGGLRRRRPASTPRRSRPPAPPRAPPRSSGASATGTSTAATAWGPWTQSAVLYTQRLWLLALSFLVPVLAFCSAVLVRWRHRAYFVLLVVVGVVLSVGAYPYALAHPARRGAQALHDRHHGRPGPALDRPGHPAGGAGAGHAAGQRGLGALWRRLPVDRRWSPPWWWPASSSPTTRRCSTATPRWPAPSTSRPPSPATSWRPSTT